MILQVGHHSSNFCSVKRFCSFKHIWSKKYSNRAVSCVSFRPSFISTLFPVHHPYLLFATVYVFIMFVNILKLSSCAWQNIFAAMDLNIVYLCTYFCKAVWWRPVVCWFVFLADMIPLQFQMIWTSGIKCFCNAIDYLDYVPGIGNGIMWANDSCTLPPNNRCWSAPSSYRPFWKSWTFEDAKKTAKFSGLIGLKWHVVVA